MLFPRSRAFGRLDALFDDQFEPDAGSFLYRRSLRAAPVRVTGAEREGFVAGYRRASRRLMWGLVGAVVVVGLGLAMVDVERGRALPDWVLQAALAGLVLLFFLLHRRAWNAPARALERRPELGLERSRAEMRRVMAERLGWRQIAGFLVVVPLAWFQYADAAARGAPVRWLWLALMALVPAATAIVAWRKWRLGRER